MKVILPTTNRRQAKAVIKKHASTTGAACQSGNASTDAVVTMEIQSDNTVKVTSNYFSSHYSLAERGCFSKKWELYIKAL